MHFLQLNFCPFLDIELNNSTTWSNVPQNETSYLRRVSQPSTHNNIIDPLSSTLGGGTSSQTELRRLKGGGNRDLRSGTVSSSPSGAKITSFAQSVLALHKLQDSSGMPLGNPASKRNTTYLGSGTGQYGNKVR